MGIMFRCVGWEEHSPMVWRGLGLGKITYPCASKWPSKEATAQHRKPKEMELPAQGTKAEPEAMHFNVCTFTQAPEGRPTGISMWKAKPIFMAMNCRILACKTWSLWNQQMGLPWLGRDSPLWQSHVRTAVGSQSQALSTAIPWREKAIYPVGALGSRGLLETSLQNLFLNFYSVWTEQHVCSA